MKNEEFLLYSRLVRRSNEDLTLKIAALNNLVSAQEYEHLKEAGVRDVLMAPINAAKYVGRALSRTGTALPEAAASGAAPISGATRTIAPLRGATGRYTLPSPSPNPRPVAGLSAPAQPAASAARPAPQVAAPRKTVAAPASQQAAPAPQVAAPRKTVAAPASQQAAPAPQAAAPAAPAGAKYYKDGKYLDVSGNPVDPARVKKLQEIAAGEGVSTDTLHGFIMSHPSGFDGAQVIMGNLQRQGAAKGSLLARPANIEIGPETIFPEKTVFPTTAPVKDAKEFSWENIKQWAKDNPGWTLAGTGAAGVGAGMLLGGDTNVTVKGASRKFAATVPTPASVNPLAEAGRDLANVLYREYPGIEKGHQYLKQILADKKITTGTGFGLGANALKTIGFTSLVGVGAKKLLAKPDPQVIYVHPDGTREVATTKKTAGVFMAPSQLNNSSPSALIEDLERRMTYSGGTFRKTAHQDMTKVAFTMSPTVRNALIGATGSAALLGATLRLKEQPPVPRPYDPSTENSALHDARRMYVNMAYDTERFARAHPTASLVAAALAGAGVGAYSGSKAWQSLRDTWGP